MTTRKEIRDWLVSVLSEGEEVLGKTYPHRVEHLDEGSPDRYTSVYITDAVYGDEIANPTLTGTLYIRFHIKLGTDDDLDLMEEEADRLIIQYASETPPPFSLSKESIAYDGSSDETYDQLSIEYSVLYRD